MNFRSGLGFVVVCSFVISSGAIVMADSLSAATNQELVRARNATAKYHDPEQAVADGYVQEVYTPGEGWEFINGALIDCTFDPEEPEVLHYMESGNGLRLVGVEYVVLNICPTEGFSGDDDEWEPEAGLPILRLNAWIWLGNTNGMFAESNPKVP